jgi:hypothetical protein
MARLLKGIYENEGKRIPDYALGTDIPEITIEFYILNLREIKFIEFRGESPKTGGYYLTDKLKEIIKSEVAD